MITNGDYDYCPESEYEENDCDILDEFEEAQVLGDLRDEDGEIMEIRYAD